MALFPNVPPVLLVIDDEQDNVDFMIRALSSSYEVRGFTDPAQALEKIEELRPVAIVVDYRMPGMTGVELVRALRQRGHVLAVVMVTAFPELDEVVHAQQAKLLYRILPKPCTADDLESHVDLAIAEVLYKGALDTYSKLLR